MPSSPHATDGAMYKIRGWEQKATKELRLLEYSCNTSEDRSDQKTTSHATRIQEKTQKRTEATDIQIEMYINTPAIYKNEISLGGAV